MSEKEYKEHVDSIEEEQEIDLLELALKVWNARRRVIRWGIIGGIVGLIVAFSIPREYTATVKLVPESGEGRAGGNLGALAAFAGINMNSSGSRDAVNPDLYPEIVASVPFATDLMEVALPTDIGEGDTLSLTYILTEETSAPWWSAVLGLPRKAISGVKNLFTGREEIVGDGVGINPFRLTPEQENLVNAINGRVTADVDNKTSVVTISVMLQDPLAAASLADTVSEKLKDFIVDYRTGKARNDLEYARKINAEAQEAYYQAQQKYANYADRNQGLVGRSAAIEQERLQNEAQLAFNLYNSTAQQVQVAEAKVQSNTPVFAVVQPASVPVKPSKPRKMIILIGFVFLGVVVAIAYSLFAPGLVKSIKEKKIEMLNSENSES